MDKSEKHSVEQKKFKKKKNIACDSICMASKKTQN